MTIPLGVSAIQDIFVDSKQIVDIRVGNTKINWVYVGSTLVWQRTPFIQTTTTANCPTNKTKLVDARDNSTYWVQKLADGKCWMLTNLAYGGGGTNTYNDAKTINLNTTNTGMTYTSPEYYVPVGANRTVEPQDPSISTDGGVTGPQYGYLYNWCAAMGGQTGTAACMNVTTPAPNTNVSICPSGWRLPTGGSGGEYQALNTIINNGITTSPARLLSVWLGMYGGLWSSGFNYQNSRSYYWSSTQYTAVNSYDLYFTSNNVYPGTDNSNKQVGRAVRCLAI